MAGFLGTCDCGCAVSDKLISIRVDCSFAFLGYRGRHPEPNSCSQSTGILPRVRYLRVIGTTTRTEGANVTVTRTQADFDKWTGEMTGTLAQEPTFYLENFIVTADTNTSYEATGNVGAIFFSFSIVVDTPYYLDEWQTLCDRLYAEANVDELLTILRAWVAANKPSDAPMYDGQEVAAFEANTYYAFSLSKSYTAGGGFQTSAILCAYPVPVHSLPNEPPDMSHWHDGFQFASQQVVFWEPERILNSWEYSDFQWPDTARFFGSKSVWHALYSRATRTKPPLMCNFTSQPPASHYGPETAPVATASTAEYTSFESPMGEYLEVRPTRFDHA